MAISRGSYNLTLVSYTCVFTLIFCFVGCVAGSCMSYGHSCWGAHGKRSGIRSDNGQRVALTRASASDAGDSQNLATSAREQWLLSRLIGKRPLASMSNRHHVRWNEIPKAQLLPRQWNDEEVTTSVINGEPFGAQNGDDIGDDEKKMTEVQEIVRDIGDDPIESSKFLFIPRSDYRGENDPQSLSLIEILGKSEEKFK